MNANKKFTVGALAIAALLLTGCGNDVPSADNAKAYPSQSASASATASSTTPATPPATAPALDDSKKSENPLGAPGVSEEEAKKNRAEFEGKPLGADVDAMFANPQRVSSEVLAVFPEDKNNTKQVVREAMATYQAIAMNETFHHARPETFKNDGDVLDVYSDEIDIEFINKAKSKASEEINGGVTQHFVAASKDGIFNYSDVTKYALTEDAFSASFNEPSVRVMNLGTVAQPMDVIRIETDMHYSYALVGASEDTKGFKGKFTATSTINIDVQPLSDGKWLIKQIGRAKNVDAALVADAKVPNV